MTRWWPPLLDPRFVIAVIVLALFAWALGHNPGDDTMKGALIGALNLAVGYYLGSSRGAASATETANKALDLAQSNTPDAGKPDVTLKPGETAQAQPEGES